MSNPRFVATLMVPVVQSFEAESIPHAQAMVREILKTDFNQTCKDGKPQAFLHSMRVIEGEFAPPAEAA